MAARQALTLAEAAARLRVSPQRVSQMLRAHVLTGPEIGPGRAPKGARRVWESSLSRETRRRAAARDESANRSPLTSNVSKRVSGRQSRSDASAQTAVLAMKIRLDAAREALREERRANQRLTRLLLAAVGEIQATQTQADRLDEIAGGYSDALTQLGVPEPSEFT